MQIWNYSLRKLWNKIKIDVLILEGMNMRLQMNLFLLISKIVKKEHPDKSAKKSPKIFKIRHYFWQNSPVMEKCQFIFYDCKQSEWGEFNGLFCISNAQCAKKILKVLEIRSNFWTKFCGNEKCLKCIYMWLETLWI